MIDYSKFRSSAKRLEEQDANHRRANSALSDLDREGVAESVIRRFETCYDCLWKMLKRYLTEALGLPDTPRYPKWYYLHSILSHFPEFERIAADKATTMGHIRRHHLSDALCIVPSDRVIARVTGVLGRLVERQVANDVASRTLTALRDTLLPKLVSGELRVRDAERLVGAIA